MSQIMESALEEAKATVADEGIFAPDQISALHKFADCLAFIGGARVPMKSVLPDFLRPEAQQCEACGGDRSLGEMVSTEDDCWLCKLCFDGIARGENPNHDSIIAVIGTVVNCGTPNCTSCNRTADKILDALRRSGLAVVPVEPTGAMKTAGHMTYLKHVGGCYIDGPTAGHVYKAMIAAAQGGVGE